MTATSFEDVRATVGEWGVEFDASAYAGRLSDEEWEQSDLIVTTFTELAYEYEDSPPAAWNVDVLERVCTELYPAKISAGEEFFANVAPVLEAFFAFLDDRGYLENADELADRVAELDDEIREGAADPDSWGPAKSMVMEAAEEHGVNVGDLDVEEVESLLEESGANEIELDPGTSPRVLESESADRFLELYGHLLVYVNDRFDVIEGIDSLAALESHFRDELLPLRDTLYREDTAALVGAFVEENPAGLDDDDLEQVAAWTDYESGEFAVVEHRDEDAVFLDPEEPRAYAVTAVAIPFTDRWSQDDLPTTVSDAALLPFEGEIVTDGWFRPDLIASMVWDVMNTDIEAAYEEAKHRYGIADSLPPSGEPERTDAERLRFYTKNRDNRERYADEIADLRERSEDLERIYHEQVGKARARSLGRQFREYGLDEAHVAIYDEQVVATAPTADDLRETLEAIMPDGKVDHPYVYHYDP
ncbi:hypothetical protein [Natrialbaceae archaeon AArc-T1-2]|uniref:hypothetical protein n=1 Tax=Natrialbaceae archaeon AArc-T1-2 TaxID=3053904 RepID=UPI00255B14CC|nr:hypothetical protein [Natrialbaceae archaeon AArc-T1-2]WIV65886.1 hypothetical protein QQ977_09250 [Natrialbaceae archaeon AArc-T1-2]